MIIIAKPIKVLPMNIVIPMIQITSDLYLIQIQTVSDSEITINSIEHRLSDSITSVKNLNVKRCDCIARLEFKDTVMKIEKALIKDRLYIPKVF